MEHSDETYHAEREFLIKIETRLKIYIWQSW